MVKKLAKRETSGATGNPGGQRKVTYSLPDRLVREVDRRTRGEARGKSRMVAEALSRYFAEQDKRALAARYAEAASDPLFRADNDAVLEDFALLDREASRSSQ